MRVAAYVGTSVALAASVVMRAAYERPNFYSACVYLQQSNACLMILTNLVLLCTCTLFYGLQRLLYGRLRPTEIERLYEHAWFAITETLLAMTIFRDDIGVWFFVMFVSLISGKVWQWIGEGRVEFVEQQPPTSRVVFFHSRLACSLFVSIIYDAMMLQYCVNTVMRQARPNMIVMFGFEFALLAVASMATFFRHILCLCDLIITQKQMEMKRIEIQAERRAERQRAREAEATEGSTAAPIADTINDEVDDNEIDVPGWEGKGRFIFYLELATDFVKLTIYMAFFVILMTFHGLPIHIMRDVLLTLRSFHRRIYDFLRYRNATRDMNTRYPDATAEDLQNDNICIICREEMRPWSQPDQVPAGGEGALAPQPAGRAIDERHRAKKLPCNHCLHISCLRSWLERQQACPTCRQPVLAEDSRRTQGNNANAAPNAGGQAGQQGPPNQPANNQPPPQRNFRQFQFGPVRFGFGVRQQPAAEVQETQQAINTLRQSLQSMANHPGNPALQQRQLLREALRNPARPESIVAQARWIDQIETRIMEEIQALNLARDQLTVVRALEAEFLRLRAFQNRTTTGGQTAQDSGPQSSEGLPRFIGGASNSNGVANQNVPGTPGLVLPPGWSITPVERQMAGISLPYPNLAQPPNLQQTTGTTRPPPPPPHFNPFQNLNQQPNIPQTANTPYTATDLQNWGVFMRGVIEQSRRRDITPSNPSAIQQQAGMTPNSTLSNPSAVQQQAGTTPSQTIPAEPGTTSTSAGPSTSAAQGTTSTSSSQQQESNTGVSAAPPPPADQGSFANVDPVSTHESDSHSSDARPLQPSVEEADDSASEG